MKRIILILSLLIALPLKGFGVDLASQVNLLKLKNGMTWVLVYRPKIPVFSGIVMVRAGGADEVNGKTGLAHMFEHMAFKGSKTVGTRDFAKEQPILQEIAKVGQQMSVELQKSTPDMKKVADYKQQIQKLTQKENQFAVKNEVWETLTRNGAEDLNAFTTKDVTGFHASMPVTQFPLWSKIFSQMVFDPVMREFYQERDVVMEERRLRYDNNPQGTLFEVLIQEAFPNGPYSWSPIGSAHDLVGLTMEDAEAFHQRYYVPANVTGVLVGDLSPSVAKQELEKTFGAFPAGPQPKEPTFPDLSFKGEKRKTITFPAEPALVIAFHKPKAPSQEDYIFDILNDLLCEGRTGRLYQRLVKEEKIAASINCSAGFPGSRGNNLFLVLAEPIQGNSLEKLEKSIEEELKAVATNLKASELEKTRLAILYAYTWGLEDNMQLAEQLASAQSVLKDWSYVSNYTKAIQTITLEAIQNGAKKYFVPENRVVIYRMRGAR